jgi:choline-sulfatase
MRHSHLPFRLSLLLLLLTWMPSGTALAQPSRPNLLFILTDDQSPETLGCYGNTVCQTPNIDRLAAEGMILHDAHHMGAWAGAVCTASRTMVMTGRTVWRIPGARGPGLSTTKAERRAAAGQSLPAVFNRAGYDTFRTCKQGNSYNEANELFTVSRIATKREGTAEGGSQWHGDQVIEYLEAREGSGDSDPFLIYYGFSHPHDPRNARPELAKKYGARNEGPPASPDENAPPLPDNYLPAHPFPHGHPGLRDEEQVQGVLTRRDEATVRNEIGREYACIEDIDRQVGRVLDKLEAMGQLDNTYVFFTSDHGIAVGRHGLMGKQNLYEHTWRVPFIVRGPGIEAGSEASGYIYLLDVLPTLCDLAGIEVPAVVEGMSFRPVLEGRAERVRDVLYGVYSGGTTPGMRAVKSDGWKLIEYDVLDGSVRQTQLFDLQSNPREFLAEHHVPELRMLLGIAPTAEQVNVADDPTAAAKRRELQQMLVNEMRRLGDPYELSAN